MKTIDDLQLLSGHTWDGHAAEFKRNPTALLVRALHEVGDIGRIEFFKLPIVTLFSPELVHEALIEKHKSLEKSLALKIMFYPVAGRGLFTSDGDSWRKQRKLMAPMFHPAAIRSYATMMNGVITRVLDRWKDGEVIDVGREMTAITMGVAAKTLFDADTLDESEDISEAIHALFNYITDQTGSLTIVMRATLAGMFKEMNGLPGPLEKVRQGIFDGLHQPIPLPTRERIRLFRAIRLLDERIASMIDERRKSGIVRDDVLSRLLAARDEDDGSFMTDRQVRDEAMTLFIAGHETTATSTTWALYLLSRNPEAHRRWKEEVDTLAGEAPSPDNVSKLTWTRGVFREALRIYPPVFAVDRIAIEDVQIGDYLFKNRTLFIIPVHAIHRIESIWPDPERFDPSRFTPELEAKRPRTAYMPFGAGPRVCIGMTFADLEAQLLLAQIAQRFDFEPVDTKHIGPDFRTALRPEGPILLRLKKRVG